MSLRGAARAIALAPAWAPTTVMAWLAPVVYFVATSLGHLEFSLWLVRNRTWGGMTFAYKEAVPWLAIGGAIVLSAWIVQRMRARREAAGAMGCFWIGWGACVALNDRFLTYSVNEYAHYPQYALLAWLIGRALDPGRQRWVPGQVIFWTTFLGMLDEVQQYLWIAPSYGHYLDFNDFLVNLIAAAAGTMLHYSGASAGAARRGVCAAAQRWWAFGVAAGIGLSIALAFAVGLLAISPPDGASLPPGGWVPSEHGLGTLYLQRASFWYQSWQPGVHRDRYLVLPPWAGMLLMAALGAAFTTGLHARTLKPAAGTDLR
jgi:hypothetical protein